MLRRLTRDNAIGLTYAIGFAILFTYAFVNVGLFFRPIQVSASAMVVLAALLASISLTFLKKRVFPKWLIFTYVFGAYALLTTLWSANAELAVSGTVIIAAGISLVTFVPTLSARWREVVLTLFIASGPVLFLVGLMASLGWIHYQDAIQTGMMDSVFQYHNTFGSYELATALAALTLALNSRSLLTRALYVTAAATSLAAVAASYSRWVWILTVLMLVVALAGGAYIKRAFHSFVTITMVVLVAVVAMPFTIQAVHHPGLKASVLTVLVLVVGGTVAATAAHFLLRITTRRKQLLVALALVILPVVGISVFAIYETSHLTTIVNRVQTINFKDASLEGRLWYYGAAIHMWTNSPIFGSGVGTWAAKFQAYEQFPYWSQQVHSVFLDQLLDFGLLGLGLWITMLTFMGLSAVRVIRARNEHSVFSLAAFLAATSLFLHALFDFDMSFPIIQFAFLVLLALATENVSTSTQKGAVTYLRVLPVHAGLLVTGALGVTLAISETALAKASAVSDDPIRQLALTQRSIAFAPYNAGAHVQLANLYYNQFATTHATNTENMAWDETNTAVRLAPWDPVIIQGAATTAFHLSHLHEAFMWSLQSTRDGKFNLKYPSTFMGIALWSGVAEYQNNPQDASTVFQSVVSMYNSINQNLASLKRVPVNMTQDWVYAMDMPTQTYVAAAEYCLGQYQTSINDLHQLSKLNVDTNSTGLYEMVALLDEARLTKGSISEIPTEMTVTSPSLTQEFQALSRIGS